MLQNIGGALALRELHLENNLIQALPPSIGHMKITNLRLDENPLQVPFQALDSSEALHSSGRCLVLVADVPSSDQLF